MTDETEQAPCSDCGQAFLPDVAAGVDVSPASGIVCAPCAENYAQCGNCATHCATDDLHAVNDLKLCDDCAEEYSTCEDCETLERTDNMHSTANDTIICETCASRNYTYSGIQETYIRDNDRVYLDDVDDHVTSEYASENCHHCHWAGTWYLDPDNMPSDSAADDEDAVLFDYSTNVLDHCPHDSKALRDGALMFGVELEMEPTRHNEQSDIVDALGGREGSQFILKSDGSLTDGVELVTVPLTLDDHRAKFGWQKVLAPVLERARSGAGTTHCGMHVHVNKAALSPLQIGKILVFLNSPLLRERVTTIAQRESNSYCERSEKKIKDGKDRSLSRYDIVNVQGKTVEFRLFRGNLRYERVLKNVEFCHALVTYCADCSIATIEQWQAFANWLLKRRGQYPMLVKFLAQANVPYFVGACPERKDKVTETTTAEDC